MFDISYPDDPFTGVVFKSADSVPMDQWRWPNFTPAELACKGTGKVMIDPQALDRLQALRDMLGAPIYLTSAYRSPKHNKAVGGVKGSLHKQARAYDVKMHNHCPIELEAIARNAGFTGFGFYPPQGNRYNFIHLDTGSAREWGERWTVKAKAPKPSAPNKPFAVSRGPNGRLKI